MGAPAPQEAPARKSAKKTAAKKTARKGVADDASKLRLVEEKDVDLGKVEEWAHELPDAYLECRALGHRWTGHSAGHHPDGGFHVVIRCTRCKGRRHLDLSERGMVLRTRYAYSEGYLTEGIGQLVGEARGVLRLTSVLRTISKSESKG